MIGFGTGSRSSKGASHLDDELRRYPPIEATDDLAAFIAVRETRLAALSGLLATCGIDLASGLTAQDHRLLLASIDDWVADHWPAVSATSEQLRRSTWLRSDCRGHDIAYAMLHDTAVLLGEMVVRRRPETYWAVDETVTGPAGAWCRPVLKGLANPVSRMPSPIDFHLLCFTAFAYVHKGAEPRIHGLTQYCRSAIEDYPLTDES